MGETPSNPRYASPAQPTERVRDSLGLLLGGDNPEAGERPWGGTRPVILREEALE